MRKTRSDQPDLFAWADAPAPETRNIVSFGHGRLTALVDHRTIDEASVQALLDSLGAASIRHQLLVLDNAVLGRRVRTDPDRVAEMQKRWRDAQAVRKRGLRIRVTRHRPTSDTRNAG